MVQETHSLLVIGFGNTLRRDDGFGQRVAEAVAAWKLSGVRSLAVDFECGETRSPAVEVRLHKALDLLQQFLSYSCCHLRLSMGGLGAQPPVRGSTPETPS